jgi:hypothetical protein
VDVANPRRVPTLRSVSFQTSGRVAIGGSYGFSEPKPLKVLVPASAFRLESAQEADGWRVRNGYAFTPTVAGSAGDVPLVAALSDLPHAADIVGFRCFVFDSVELDEAPGEADLDDLQIGFFLRRQRRLSTSSEQIAAAIGGTEGESLSIRTVAAGSFNLSRVDRNDYAYRIEGLYNSESAGESLRFYGCELDLDVRFVDPR